jgi:diguanylate cyclase (GGDEF)-like protein/PAS domain S-box-containing protein
MQGGNNGGSLHPDNSVWVPARKYAFALVIFLLALGARFAILPREAGLGFITFYPAVVLAGLLYGAGPGLLTMTFSAIAVNYLLMPPFGAFKLDYAQLLPMGIFCFASAVVCYVADRMRRNIDEAREIKKHLQSIFDASPDALFVIDAQGVITMANMQAETLLGFTHDEFVGHSYEKLIPNRYRKNHSGLRDKYLEQPVVRPMGRGNVVKALRKDGSELDVEISLSPIHTDQGLLMASSLRDITERKKAEEKIRELAFFDQLTGLPNRTLLMDRLKQAMAESQRRDHYGALLLFDLDDFKTLNDTLGHDVGDELLKQTATRLKTLMRESDTFARLGGDEFVVILSHLGVGEQDAAIVTASIAKKLLAALNQTYQLGEHVHHSTASIGATIFKGEAIPIDSLIKQADLAMYKTKATGRNSVHFFDSEIESAVVERVAMVADLREGLLRGQFVLHYQAQATSSQQLCGAEALLRWQHPRRGLVPPHKFIGVAEESKLILPLGRWVLETACVQLARWAGMPAMAHLTLAVNVSSLQFRQDEFVESVLAILDATGADPHRLKLELTETLVVEDVSAAIEKMSALKAKGVGFSLDDFGTGYSSLSYLKKFPLDQLKIDRSFVQDVLHDPNDAAIAKTIVALGQTLGFSVIAEGVETVEQRNFLENIGCHAYQGYLFSHPLPLNEFEQFVEQTLRLEAGK